MTFHLHAYLSPNASLSAEFPSTPAAMHVLVLVLVLTLDSRCCLMTVALAWTTGSLSSLPLSLPLPWSSFSSSSLSVSASTAAEEAGAAVERTLRRSPPERAAADSRTDSGEPVDDEEERVRVLVAEPSRE